MERDDAIGRILMDLGFPNHILSEQADRAIAETIAVASRIAAMGDVLASAGLGAKDIPALTAAALQRMDDFTDILIDEDWSRTVTPSPTPASEPRFTAAHVGRRVHHQKFKGGTIADVDGIKIEVDFDQPQTRKRVLDSFLTLATDPQ